MKLTKRSRWIIIVILLVVISALVFAQFDSVRATFSDMHMVVVMYRVESELMQKTPAGQYYESLFWKHNDELMRIASANPEHREEERRVLRLFVPGLEALLDGKGDTVKITFEQVDGVKAQLDWFASRGNSALKGDIEKEQQRLPLDHFVGMTMDEAWDFINSTWTRDSVEVQTVVPDSDGKWAYYVHNGVYLEYPASYFFQTSGSEKDIVYFMPSTGSPEQWAPCVMKVHVWNVPTDEKDAANPRSSYPSENMGWESVIQNTEFQGVEFVFSRPNIPVMDMHAFLYNQENQIAVDIWVFANENPQMTGPSDYLEMINQRYEYFQHMVDNLRIWGR